MASLANQTISSTYDGLIKTSSDNAVPVSGVQALEDGSGNALALSVGRSGNGVSITGNLASNSFITCNSSSSGDYVRVYGASGTAQWDIYGSGENLRFSENSGGGGALQVDSNILVGGNQSILAENNLRFKSTGASYIDHNTVGQSINFRVSSASSLDTTAMTINSSGNVGIGTSPNRLLHLYGGSDTTWLLMNNSATGSASTDGFSIAQVGADVSFINREIGYIDFQTSDVPRMRIESGGNINLKGAATGVQYIYTDGTSTGNTGQINICAGAGSSDYGSGIVLYGRNHASYAGSLYLGASGGAGDIIFGRGQTGLGVELMRIDSSGNVGIGATPSFPLHLSNTATPQFVIQNTAGGTNAEKMAFEMGAGDVFKIKSLNDNNTVRVDNILTLNAIDGKISSTGASEGVVKVVGSSASHRGEFLVEGAGQFTGSLVAVPSSASTYNGISASTVGITTSSTPLVFATSNSERMRITSGGSLQVGGTNLYSVGADHLIQGSSSTGGNGAVMVYNDTGTALCPALTIANADTSTDATNRFVQFYASVGSTTQAMGGIVGNGAENVQFATLSDEREKENITEISGSLDKIMQIQVSKFDWIKTGEHIKAGFIAQNVETVFPEYVIENVSSEGEEPRKGITGGMSAGYIAHLTKAIQELKAEIELLKSQLS